MITKLVITIILCLSMTAQAHAESWFTKDKALHFVVSLTLGALAHHYIDNNINCRKAESRALTLFTISSIGALKEWSDEEFSYKDLGADAAGASVSLLF